MEEKSLKDEIRELTKAVQENLDQAKPKKFRSIKTRLGKKKMKKGYLLVCEIYKNKAVNITRQPIIDGTVKLQDTYHAVSDLDIFYYQPILGKLKPIVFLPKDDLNPWNPLKLDNKTYGQKYVMSRMMTDEIKAKRQFNIMTWIIVLLIIGGVIYYLARGGFS